MAKNLKFGEPPVFKGDVKAWIRDTERFLRTVYEDMYGFEDRGGSLDGNDNITSASDPGIADGTPAGNALVINAMNTNLKATGIVEA